MRSFAAIFLVLVLPLISHSQKTDSSAAKPNFATLVVYHPKYELRGIFDVYLSDTVVCSIRRNSVEKIRIYKEGRAEVWAKPQKKNSVNIDFKFGEEYYLKCWLEKNENNIASVIQLVDSSLGRFETAEILASYDTLKIRKARRLERERLDTVPRRNTIYVDLGGPAILYSLNYDFLFRVKKNVMHSVSVGAEVIDWFKYPEADPQWLNYNMFFPVSYNFIFGKQRSHFELGFGATVHPYRYMYYHWTSMDVDAYYEGGFDLIFSPKIGWRFQSKSSGLFLRAAFVPILNVFSYLNGQKFPNKPEWNEPSSYFFFCDEIGFWDNVPGFPWVGISAGYSFNFKKRK